MNWIKSSWCHWDEPQCVEVRATGRLIEMRDSKLGDASPRQRFTHREWRAFLKAAPTWIPAVDHMYRIGDLAYTRDEWAVFLRGVSVGEFTIGRLRDRVAA